MKTITLHITIVQLSTIYRMLNLCFFLLILLPDTSHLTKESFKCYYRQKLVKHIIARCTGAQTVDQIMVTTLDAIKWIDKA